MNDWKTSITLLACCVYLTVAPSASADYVGVTTVNPDDPDIEFLCTKGNGFFVPGPLTVCKVFAGFDDPDDRLLSVGNADLQVFNRQVPDVFFQHSFNFTPYSASCAAIPNYPDLICDTFVTLGIECGPSPPADDNTAVDGEFITGEFALNGHILGGWFNSDPWSGQGCAGNYPDLQVLILQSSVARGMSLSGDIDIFWHDFDIGEAIAELDVVIECAATCGACPTDHDGDGNTDAADLAVLLGNWGPVDGGDCQDADDDGLIGRFDLAALLGAWGPCPE